MPASPDGKKANTKIYTINNLSVVTSPHSLLFEFVLDFTIQPLSHHQVYLVSVFTPIMWSMVVVDSSSASKDVSKTEPPSFTSYVNVPHSTDKLDGSNYYLCLRSNFGSLGMATLATSRRMLKKFSRESALDGRLMPSCVASSNPPFIPPSIEFLSPYYMCISLGLGQCSLH